jgi:hypothetical protein
VPVVSTLGHSPSTPVLGGGVGGRSALGLPNGSGTYSTEARLSTGPALDDARAGGGPDGGRTGARSVSSQAVRLEYSVRQPTQVRSRRACGAAGDLKQSSTVQYSDFRCSNGASVDESS